MTGPGAQVASGDEVLGAVGVGGGDDGEDVAGLGGEFDVALVGEREAVVAGGGDEDDAGGEGGVGDGVEGGLEAGAVAGGDVDEGAERHGDDVGVVLDGVFDALNDPAEKTGGLAGDAAGRVGWGGGGGEAFEDFDVEDGGLRGDSGDEAGVGPEGSGGERGRPGSVAGLVCGGAVVAGDGRAVWSISERLRARLGAMSGWAASTPESRMAMRTPAPLVVSQGPGDLEVESLPKPPTARTAQPCGGVVEGVGHGGCSGYGGCGDGERVGGDDAVLDYGLDGGVECEGGGILRLDDG